MTGGVQKLIGVLIFVIVAFALLPTILTSVTDTASLAILGSFTGGSALVLIVGTVVIAGLILWIVNFFFPGAVATGISAVRRRRR